MSSGICKAKLLYCTDATKIYDRYRYWYRGTILRRYQICRRQTQRATNKTRKKALRSYADMTIYAIGPARLVPKMCHHKLPTTIVTSLALSNI